MSLKILALLALYGSLSAAAPQPRPDGAAMLEKLAGLSGEWRGTFAWSGARSGGGPLEVTYRAIGNGSAVQETLIQGGMPTMTTIYHLDGSTLRMTHFCGARNQPRLRSSKIDLAQGVAEFEFVDVTNAGPKNPGYVEGFRIHLVDPAHLRLRFLFKGGGPEATEDIILTRA